MQDSDAGWSSLVARRAHNPKVVGSNPAPATNNKNKGLEEILSPFLFIFFNRFSRDGINMEGWSEEEIRNKDLMAPCGLYCGTCGIYIATRDKNEKFKNVMANLYGSKPEETECLGCMQSDPPEKLYAMCKLCKIRD